MADYTYPLNVTTCQQQVNMFAVLVDTVERLPLAHPSRKALLNEVTSQVLRLAGIIVVTARRHDHRDDEERHQLDRFFDNQLMPVVDRLEKLGAFETRFTGPGIPELLTALNSEPASPAEPPPSRQAADE